MPEGKLRVLWATDGSANAREAIPVLRQLVLPATAQLVVLAVAPHPLVTGARPDPAYVTRATAQAKQEALEAAESLAEAEMAALDLSEGVGDAQSAWGHPIETILQVARRRGVELIVMGAKGHSNLRRILLGSISDGIVQHANVPVLIVRPGSAAVRKVLVCYDGSSQAKAALKFLERLALPAEAELLLRRVVEPFAVPRGTPIGYRSRAIEEAHAINERRRRQAERSLRDAAARLEAAGHRVSSEVLTGIAATELVEAARKASAGLVVVGSRKPSPARHYLLGSTAEKLVRHAPMSVLVVR